VRFPDFGPSDALSAHPIKSPAAAVMPNEKRRKCDVVFFNCVLQNVKAREKARR
jgi:hypothetical protein